MPDDVNSSNRVKLGYFGFLFGGLIALLPAAAVYYAAKYMGKPDYLTSAIIIYILMFIGFTGLIYVLKIRKIEQSKHIQ